MNAQDLRWEEWCFDQIGKELFLCVHWEYARESPTIRAHVARYGRLLKELRQRLRRERKAFDARLSETFLDNFPSYFPERFGSHLLTTVLERRSYSRTIKDWRVALPIFATTFTGRIVLEPDHFPDTQWMALPLSVREQIARRVEPPEPTLVEHRPWHKYSKTSLAHGSQIIGKVGKDCWEDVVLKIHWSEDTNDEIVSAFRKWITKYRKDVAKVPPPHRIRAAVNKAWLKRLAEMRLWKAGSGLEGALSIIRAHTVAEDSAAKKRGVTARTKDPQLTEPISSRADEDSMREDISRVSKDLRHLFGWIVPKNEMPISYPFRRLRHR